MVANFGRLYCDPKATQFGVEFGSKAMVAESKGRFHNVLRDAHIIPGMAQTAVHQLRDIGDLFDPEPESVGQSVPLLVLLQQAYDSPILKPKMPYDPNAFISARLRDAMKDGRPNEIRRLCALWWPANLSQLKSEEVQQLLEQKVEELFWVNTLILAGTGKEGRKPRLDFFFMHALNATIFLPSLFRVIREDKHKIQLLRGLLPTIFIFIIMRGRPRINPKLLMSYTASPRPSVDRPIVDPEALGNPADTDIANPWPAIIESSLLAPDAHVIKAIRTLYYAAQRYGQRAAGQVPGAFVDGKESHIGSSILDGTVFVRAAGVIMDTLGWMAYGERPGEWDRSALGWEDAWKNGD